MDSFFTRFRNPLTLIAIVLAQVIALAIQVQRPTGLGAGHTEGHKVTELRHWMLAVVTPFERLTHASSFSVRGVWSNYVDLRHTRERNQQLQQEVARLRVEQAEFAQDAAQGRRLEALLKFQHSYVTATVAAQVIGTSGTDHARMLTLDKGRDDGIRPDMAVMTPDGVVGKIRDTEPHTSQLLLLNDPSSGAGVLFASTRIRAIVRGNANGGIEIDNLTQDNRIKPGEQVLTSGGDGVYPRGLPVGVIESIAPDPQHQPFVSIKVKPAANLSRLEEVLVITGTSSTLPPDAAADAAQADATALANQKAADIIAARLPSINENTGANGATGPSGATGATGNVAPVTGKPAPTLHPDRYSPDATPAAADLQPGAPAPPSDSDSAHEVHH